MNLILEVTPYLQNQIILINLKIKIIFILLLKKFPGKKEIKCIPLELDSDQAQTIDKVFIPQTSKQTEVIEGDADVAVNRIMEILKSEIKVF